MQEPLVVPASEVERHFARYQDAALTRPVAVTSEGHPPVIMISEDEFQRLRRRDRQAFRVEDLPVELIELLEAVEPSEESKQFNHEVE